MKLFRSKANTRALLVPFIVCVHYGVLIMLPKTANSFQMLLPLQQQLRPNPLFLPVVARRSTKPFLSSRERRQQPRRIIVNSSPLSVNEEEERKEESNLRESEGADEHNPITDSDSSPSNNDGDTPESNTLSATEKAIQQARELKEMARKARLEAEKLDTMLTLEKIAKLEESINDDNASRVEGDDEDRDIRNQIRNLKERINGPNDDKKGDIKSQIRDLNERINGPKSKSKEEEKEKEDKATAAKVLKGEALKEDVSDLDFFDSFASLVIPEDGGDKDLDEAYKDFGKELKSMVLNVNADLENAIVELAKLDMDHPESSDNTNQTENSKNDTEDKETIRSKQIKEAEELFSQEQEETQERFAAAYGFSTLSNTTAIILSIVEDVKFNDDGSPAAFRKYKQSLAANNLIREAVPESFRKFDNTPSKDVVDKFLYQVLLENKIFSAKYKPKTIVGGYIIRGANRLESGDELVAAIEEGLQKVNIADKLQFFYIKSVIVPNELESIDFEVLMENDIEENIIYVTGSDLSPRNTNGFVKPIVNVAGVLCTLSFAFGTFYLNESFKVDEANAIFWVEQIFLPLITSLFLPQLVHEIAHQVVAFKEKFQTGFPTIVPSVQLGLQGCITQLKTPPKNFNALFDFAIAGPLAGMLVSIILLFIGIEKQAFMDESTVNLLPSLPMVLVRSSTLAGGIIEWLLGDGILRSSDPLATIHLHPYVVGGFIGIATNALNLLPLGRTDGGRLNICIFSRDGADFVTNSIYFIILVAGLFGGDDSSMLLLYCVYAFAFQRETEIPCRNETDGITDVRAGIAFASAFLVALALIPLGNG